jgi:hypothetical protein
MVIPSGPTDSVAAVVPHAVAHFAQGAAVFTPLRPDRYEVRWINAGLSKQDPICSLDAGSFVASSGLVALACALQDSLEQRAAKAVADSNERLPSAEMDESAPPQVIQHRDHEQCEGR